MKELISDFILEYFQAPKDSRVILNGNDLVVLQLKEKEVVPGYDDPVLYQKYLRLIHKRDELMYAMQAVDWPQRPEYYNVDFGHFKPGEREAYIRKNDQMQREYQLRYDECSKCYYSLRGQKDAFEKEAKSVQYHIPPKVVKELLLFAAVDLAHGLEPYLDYEIPNLEEVDELITQSGRVEWFFLPNEVKLSRLEAFNPLFKIFCFYIILFL